MASLQRVRTARTRPVFILNDRLDLIDGRQFADHTINNDEYSSECRGVRGLVSPHILLYEMILQWSSWQYQTWGIYIDYANASIAMVKQTAASCVS